MIAAAHANSWPFEVDILIAWLVCIVFNMCAIFLLTTFCLTNFLVSGLWGVYASFLLQFSENDFNFYATTPRKPISNILLNVVWCMCERERELGIETERVWECAYICVLVQGVSSVMLEKKNELNKKKWSRKWCQRC